MLNTDWLALALTLKLAFISALVLVVVCLPFAWWLARRKTKLTLLIEIISALPLVLPPTVIGFYLLVFFAPDNPLGAFFQSATGSTLAFSFTGLVVASCFYSLPFVLQPIQQGFEQIPNAMLLHAKQLGCSKLQRFIRIAVPLNIAPILFGFGLGFAHTLGEFGVVLMIGGSIPDETRVISIVLFDYVETLEWQSAHSLAFTTLGVSFALLCGLYTLRRKFMVP